MAGFEVVKGTACVEFQPVLAGLKAGCLHASKEVALCIRAEADVKFLWLLNEVMVAPCHGLSEISLEDDGDAVFATATKLAAKAAAMQCIFSANA